MPVCSIECMALEVESKKGVPEENRNHQGQNGISLFGITKILDFSKN